MTTETIKRSILVKLQIGRVVSGYFIDRFNSWDGLAYFLLFLAHTEPLYARSAAASLNNRSAFR